MHVERTRDALARLQDQLAGPDATGRLHANLSAGMLLPDDHVPCRVGRVAGPVEIVVLVASPRQQLRHLIARRSADPEIAIAHLDGERFGEDRRDERPGHTGHRPDSVPDQSRDAVRHPQARINQHGDATPKDSRARSDSTRETGDRRTPSGMILYPRIRAAAYGVAPPVS